MGVRQRFSIAVTQSQPIREAGDRSEVNEESPTSACTLRTVVRDAEIGRPYWRTRSVSSPLRCHRDLDRVLARKRAIHRRLARRLRNEDCTPPAGGGSSPTTIPSGAKRQFNMAKRAGSCEWQGAVILLAGMVVLVVVVVALYWAQSVFIPIALAAFLTFLLNPLVASLRQCRLGRTPSVLIAVLISALLLTIIGWMATSQISSLLDELPHYTQTVKEKIRSLKQVALGSSPIVKMMADIYDEIALPSPAHTANSGRETEDVRVREDRPRTVVVDPATPSWLSRAATFLNPLMESVAQLGLAFVLLMFMLLRREELRNRIIRLLGQGRIVATTRFVDEAGQRISRFLLMQALVNGAFGLIIGAGLFLIGVRYALLWGFLAAIFRYLPFIGPILAAVFPAVISFAMSSTLRPPCW